MQVTGNSHYSSLIGIKTAVNSVTETTAINGKELPSSQGSSVAISQAAHEQSIQTKNGLIDMSGEEGAFKLGLMALGNDTIQGWAEQGLELDREAVIAAGEAFQQAFKQMKDESEGDLAGSSLALNKHQIVINSQQTPDWFKQEYQAVLASMDNQAMKEAFQQGELFVTSKPNSQAAHALANYSAVDNYR